MSTDNEPKFMLLVKYGRFGLAGEWEPNPYLTLTEDEQRENNRRVDELLAARKEG